jgi:CheY-like chemotaxis protein
MSAKPDTRRALEVLIVEDHRDARTTMRMLLTLRHGHVVHEAADGASALRVALENPPDVALIDLGLPDMSGHEVARRMRAALGSAIVLVAVTGYGSPDDRRLAHEAGFDFHLVKPVEPKALARIFDDVRTRSAGVSPAADDGRDT